MRVAMCHDLLRLSPCSQDLCACEILRYFVSGLVYQHEIGPLANTSSRAETDEMKCYFSLRDGGMIQQHVKNSKR